MIQTQEHCTKGGTIEAGDNIYMRESSIRFVWALLMHATKIGVETKPEAYLDGYLPPQTINRSN